MFFVVKYSMSLRGASVASDAAIQKEKNEKRKTILHLYNYKF
jgi:hypothetical protein